MNNYSIEEMQKGYIVSNYKDYTERFYLKAWFSTLDEVFYAIKENKAEIDKSE